MTVEEIERGLRRLPSGRRRRELQGRWSQLVEDFAETIAGYDLAAARETAGPLVDAEKAGRPMSLADAQIAGICRAGGYDLATRDVKDFAAVPGLGVINPFA